ncbi:MAG TPA: MarR family winged helix-turn-helix transcriptional regulator [Bacteroidia bacterium]|nr:winged helix-turn-helix transcriptional regulator [Bacteroidia bacterium]QQR95582.1 MAG: winged helix-turn-helix transcriptional regulator [Bacteroidota bacterium]MBP7714930.1 winged helix-turn-helix transcriptional regulator [Bacteroidia bacterium]MBP8668254.1 winged helix-turn-helix transcriptional regulator [Bacteroidia bacterium]HOZ81887.1 MarR family winged helix-turn-helix transcriptional regulator [Bacteroidia bacterium]
MSKSDFDLNFQNKSVDGRIVAALERISQAFRVLLWQESKDFSLSPIQIQVIIFLLHHSDDKCKISYLADEFNMTKATISETVKTLEHKKLIQKVYEEFDNRSYTIQLTKSGNAIATQTALFSKEFHKPIAKLSNDGKENMLLSLLNIINHLNKTGVITIQRMCLSCTHHALTTNGENHFCKLLNRELLSSELRIDCPEHVLST